MYGNKHTNCPETRESQNRTFIRELEGGVVKNVCFQLSFFCFWFIYNYIVYL